MEGMILKLKCLLNELLEYPYGKEIRGGEKTIPPNPNQYARLVDSIIDELIVLHNKGYINVTLSIIDKIRSIRANQVNTLIADYPITKNNALSNHNYDMERISCQIADIIGRVIDFNEC